MEAFEYSDVEGGPVVRTDWVGTTLYGEDRYTTKVVSSQEACYKDLERQVAPFTAYLKTGILILFTCILLVISSLIQPVVGWLLVIGLCAAIFSAFQNHWYFNDSEKLAVPGALKSLAKELLIGVIIITILTGIGLLIIWILEKIGAFFAAR